MENLIILSALILGVAFVVMVMRNQDDEQQENRLKEYPYLLKDNFLSAAELSFYLNLKQIVGERASISTKVRLGDIFWVKPKDKSKFRAYRNRIDRKHVDFLLCDSKTMQPLVGIELDDRSHQRTERQERDAFVDKVFDAAQLPMLHLPAKRGYVAAEIEAMLAPYLNRTASAQQPQTTAQQTCPKCGSGMILRTAKQGANAGKQFWGCSKYPDCKAALPYKT